MRRRLHVRHARTSVECAEREVECCCCCFSSERAATDVTSSPSDSGQASCMRRHEVCVDCVARGARPRVRRTGTDAKQSYSSNRRAQSCAKTLTCTHARRCGRHAAQVRVRAAQRHTLQAVVSARQHAASHALQQRTPLRGMCSNGTRSGHGRSRCAHRFLPNMTSSRSCPFLPRRRHSRALSTRFGAASSQSSAQVVRTQAHFW